MNKSDFWSYAHWSRLYGWRLHFKFFFFKHADQF